MSGEKNKTVRIVDKPKYRWLVDKLRQTRIMDNIIHTEGCYILEQKVNTAHEGKVIVYHTIVFSKHPDQSPGTMYIAHYTAKTDGYPSDEWLKTKIENIRFLVKAGLESEKKIAPFEVMSYENVNGQIKLKWDTLVRAAKYGNEVLLVGSAYGSHLILSMISDFFDIEGQFHHTIPFKDSLFKFRPIT